MSSFARFLNFPRESTGGGSDLFASTPLSLYESRKASMDLSTLPAHTWDALVLAATLGRLARLAAPGPAPVAAALFALAPLATTSTSVMLAFHLVGDIIAVWAYRGDADTAVLRRLIPVLVGVSIGAALLALNTQAQIRRTIGPILSNSRIQRHTEKRPSTTKHPL